MRMIGQISRGLALLAGLLIVAGAACGDGGESHVKPAGTVAAPTQSSSFNYGTTTPTPPGIGGEPINTRAAATATPASTAAHPTRPAATPTATVSEDAALVVGYDMDPSGNTATALGIIDRCVSVSAEREEEFQVDVFLNRLPWDSVAGFEYLIDFPESTVKLVAQNHSMLVAAEPEAQIADLSDDVPATTSPHAVGVPDFGPAEYNPPYYQGVLGRYTFKVLPTAAAGTYKLTLNDTGIVRDTMPDPDYPDYPLGGYVPIAAIWDGNFEPSYGIIAVDVSCDTVSG